MENVNETISKINAHLEKSRGVIAIVQNNNKLIKPWATHNKFNWTKQDVLKQATSIQEFIEQLPQYGFTDGATLELRQMEGATRGRAFAFITLKFSEKAMQNAQQQPQTQIPTQQPTQHIHQPMQQMAAPIINGMAYANVPQHELIDMKVKDARYADLLEKWKKAEDELSQAKSDLRMEREKLFSAERKLELIEDKWELKLDRERNDKKTFLDSETGKELITGLSAALPNIIEAIKPKQPLGLGAANPLANLPQTHQQFVSQIQDMPETGVVILSKTATALLEVPGFAEEITKNLDTLLNQQ